MTLCIASISENGTAIVGIADRMLTVDGIIEYEPREQKIITIVDSIFVMIAGDMSLHSEIIAEIKERINNEADKKGKVKDIAMLYHNLATSIPAERNLSNILAIYGFDKESFMNNQTQMQQTIVDRILADEFPSIQAIIAGVDSTGAHIYKLNGSKITCEDFAGYTAIGNGSWLAEAELTRIAYARFVGVAQSAFLCYMAKKTSETTSGVGRYTDIVFAIENYLNFFPEALLLELHNYYLKMKTAEHNTQVRYLTKWTEYVKSHEKQIETANEHEKSDENTSANNKKDI